MGLYTPRAKGLYEAHEYDGGLKSAVKCVKFIRKLGYAAQWWPPTAEPGEPTPKIQVIADDSHRVTGEYAAGTVFFSKVSTQLLGAMNSAEFNSMFEPIEAEDAATIG